MSSSKPTDFNIEHSSTSLRSKIESKSPVRIMLLGSGDRRPQLIPEADKLRPVISEFGEIILEDLRYEEDLTKHNADLAIVLGGDGSILRAAKQMMHCQVPVLGVNLGKLGFLADILPENIGNALHNIKTGCFRIVEHLMIDCEVYDDGAAGDEPKLIAKELGLNEVAILGGPPFSIQKIDLLIDGDHATTYRCDGLIVSTPVGSTAHNLSAGGPILQKNLQAFVISPISPHTLTVRPVVDTADRVFEIIVRNPNKSTSIVLDGQLVSKLTSQHRVCIRRAKSKFMLVEVRGQSYYQTLREKLGWGGNFQSIEKQ